MNINLKGSADSLYFRYDADVPVGVTAQFCTISLNRIDRIRLICCPDSVVNMIRGVIQRVGGMVALKERTIIMIAGSLDSQEIIGILVKKNPSLQGIWFSNHFIWGNMNREEP